MPQKTVEPFATIRSVPSVARGQEAPGLENVQGYLQRFGYLPPAAFRANLLDDPTSEALSRFQQWHGLPVTGRFDDQTRERMTKHRCGMADLEDGVAFSTNCAWPHPCLTFAFEDGTADTTGATEFQAMRNAFATWAASAPLTFAEVAAAQGPDVTIDWRPANDPDHSMVGGVLAHADFPPACGVVTNSLPKPVHFDDSEHLWTIGAVVNGFDVETVGLHELGHILGLRHSNVGGSVMFPSVSDNFTLRSLTADDRGGIQQLYPASVLAPGTYTIRQKGNGRFLDAHEIEPKDFRLVTRTAQANDTQKWVLKSIGTVFVVRQKSNSRYLDAHDSNANDFRLVTRPAQANDSQRWVVLPHGDGSSRIQQLSNRRFVDAHEIEDKDFAAVTRTVQANDTQRWILAGAGANTFTVKQKSSGRFLDAHEIASKDFSVVTRPTQANDTQRWIFAPVGAVFTIQQKSNNRFVDAHEIQSKDFATVTRPAQANDTQRWIVMPGGGGSFTVRQLSGGRFLDAHLDSGNDFSVVTRTAQNDDTQRWLFEKV